MVAAGAAHIILRIAVSARRDERRQAQLMPIMSSKHGGSKTFLRSGEQAGEWCVTGERRCGGGVAAQCFA